MNFGQAAFGLKQVKLTDTAGSNPVFLPSAMMLHFTEKTANTKFVAEGVWIAARTMPVGVEWELEAGGISLDAYAKMTGRAATAVGTTPNRTVTMAGDAAVEFPYFRIYGQAVGDTGTDDIHCVIYRCKLQEIEGTFRNGEFWVSSCAGIGIDDSTFGLFQFVQHETKVSL